MPRVRIPPTLERIKFKERFVFLVRKKEKTGKGNSGGFMLKGCLLWKISSILSSPPHNRKGTVRVEESRGAEGRGPLENWWIRLSGIGG